MIWRYWKKSLFVKSLTWLIGEELARRRKQTKARTDIIQKRREGLWLVNASTGGIASPVLKSPALELRPSIRRLLVDLKVQLIQLM